MCVLEHCFVFGVFMFPLTVIREREERQVEQPACFNTFRKRTLSTPKKIIGAHERR